MKNYIIAVTCGFVVGLIASFLARMAGLSWWADMACVLLASAGTAFAVHQWLSKRPVYYYPKHDGDIPW